MLDIWGSGHPDEERTIKPMKIYTVGGSVRDYVLTGSDSCCTDIDYVVVGGTPDELLGMGFIQVGKSFPVFLHPETRAEYALARLERKTGQKHADFAFTYSADTTLEQDARRRDFTVNSLYRSVDETGALGEIVDPTGRGLDDCHSATLRHVGPSFAEDPLRVLRCGRLAAQLRFEVAPETLELMAQMVERGMLGHLSRERIDNEFTRAMAPGYDSRRFLEIMYACGALRQLYPEIAAYVDCAEKTAYHTTGSTWGHVLAALDAGIEEDSRVKTAIVYHDVYKPVAYGARAREDRYVAHDDEVAVAYLRQQLSSRKFDARTKQLCGLAVRHHMRMWEVARGMSVGKWVDMLASITHGFRQDYAQWLD